LKLYSLVRFGHWSELFLCMTLLLSFREHELLREELNSALIARERHELCITELEEELKECRVQLDEMRARAESEVWMYEWLTRTIGWNESEAGVRGMNVWMIDMYNWMRWERGRSQRYECMTGWSESEGGVRGMNVWLDEMGARAESEVWMYDRMKWERGRSQRYECMTGWDGSEGGFRGMNVWLDEMRARADSEVWMYDWMRWERGRSQRYECMNK